MEAPFENFSYEDMDPYPYLFARQVLLYIPISTPTRTLLQPFAVV